MVITIINIIITIIMTAAIEYVTFSELSVVTKFLFPIVQLLLEDYVKQLLEGAVTFTHCMSLTNLSKEL